MVAIHAMQRIPITAALIASVLWLHAASDLQSCFTFQFIEFSWLDMHRVLTCHLLHWSTEHLVWDLGVFVILGTLCEQRSRGRYAATLFFTAVAVPTCILYWSPEVESYRGLSGIDTALFGSFVMDLLVDRIKDRDWTGMTLFSLFLAGLFGKITMEMLSHANLFVSDTSFTPVPLAHLVGGAIGLVVGGWESGFDRCIRNACRDARM